MFFRSNRALTALERKWRRTTHTALSFRHWTVADPDGICTRTPLRALVFRRVRLRSIRVLTASKINSGRNTGEVPWSPSGLPLARKPALVFAAMVFRPGTGFDLERSIFTFTAQKNKFGRNTDEDFCRASATRLTHALDDPVPWSPSRAMLTHRAGARFRIPSCRRERGSGGNAPWWRSSLIFTARKESQEKTEQSV